MLLEPLLREAKLLVLNGASGGRRLGHRVSREAAGAARATRRGRCRNARTTLRLPRRGRQAPRAEPNITFEGIIFTVAEFLSLVLKGDARAHIARGEDASVSGARHDGHVRAARCAAPRAPRLGVSTSPRALGVSLSLPHPPTPRRDHRRRLRRRRHRHDPWNKGPIDLDNRLYAYLLEHTREPEILRKLRVETATLRGSQMVPPEQVPSSASSSSSRAPGESSRSAPTQAIPPSRWPRTPTRPGRTPRRVRQQRAVARGGAAVLARRASRPHRRTLGRRGATLDNLIAESDGERTYDIGFVDADKRGYWEYYEKLLRLVDPGLIAIDNVLWYGKVQIPTCG